MPGFEGVNVGNGSRHVRDPVNEECFPNQPCGARRQAGACCHRQRVAVAAVNDHHVVHAAGQRVLAGPQLRDHARRGRAIRHQLRGGRRLEQRDGRAVRAEHAGRRPRDHEPSRAEPRRQMTGERVGVDVEQPSVAADADAGDDRDEPVAEQRPQEPRIGVG